VKTHIDPQQLLDSDLWESLKAEMLADLLQEFDAVPLDDDDGRRRVAYCRWAVRETHLKLERMLRNRK
jgi:hypothetical protein